MFNSDRYKDEFINEIEFVIDKMNETPNQLDKVFYFSAIHAFLKRIMNLEYNIEILFFYRLFDFFHRILSEDLKKKFQFIRPQQNFFPPYNKIKNPPEKSINKELNIPDLNEPPKKIPFELIDPKFFDYLIDYLEDFKKAIVNDDDLLDPIKKISELIYLFSGNGKYLHEKGVIKLDLNI